MSDGDKYLHELDEIRGREHFRSARREYKSVAEHKEKLFQNRPNPRNISTRYHRRLLSSLNQDNPNYEQAKVHAGAIAYHLMSSPYPNDIIFGAKIYEKMGKGKKVIPRLIKNLDLSSRNLNDDEYTTVRSFIERNAGERKSHGRTGIEGKTAVFLISTVAGIALSVFSFRATGNAIGTLETTSGLLGIFLFVFGLMGITFNSGK